MESNIRPGDDFLLRFGKKNSEVITGVSKDEDFIAVYDKKMLWRANLYIEETNIEDWNDKYKWNAPLTINDTFNKGLSDEEHYNEFGFVKANGDSNDSEIIWYSENKWNHNGDEENVGNGGQVVDILQYNSIFGDTNKLDSVAYNYPESTTTINGRDTPFMFNDKILVQKNRLSEYYNNVGTRFKKAKTEWGNLENVTDRSLFTLEKYNELVEDYTADLNESEPFTDHGISLLSWNETTAFENNWDNYVKEQDQSIDLYLPGLGLIEWSKNPNIQASEEFRESIYSVVNNAEANGTFLAGKEYWSDRAAGVDCIGFAQNAANISGNKWPANNINRAYPRTLEDSQLRDENSTLNYSTFIVGKSNSETNNLGKYKVVGNYNFVKPGDIFYHIGDPDSNNPGGGKHIGIVLSIGRDSLGNIIPSECKIIESNFSDGGSNLSWVRNSQTLNWWVENDRHWRVVRLNKGE
ncbi:hypothetical protein EW093_05540 [Thiospirochaeta perfilievii]|uniref:Uncharacterized protein n=1 Tax=Thiospirochaeta perfilievii TaxID=252967 RepID=A0A5C1QA22_9SPIO|nr:hypothetical protein [Thiospirochaeta perfilievii]QEN04188.1 hypothetical protein EW093_05540 [Thiospirochaeta perfilievii]